MLREAKVAERVENQVQRRVGHGIGARVRRVGVDDASLCQPSNVGRIVAVARAADEPQRLRVQRHGPPTEQLVGRIGPGLEPAHAHDGVNVRVGGPRLQARAELVNIRAVVVEDIELLTDAGPLLGVDLTHRRFDEEDRRFAAVRRYAAHGCASRFDER